MDRQPLVSIICLCYNHAPYLEDAILSAIHQKYEALEIIVVDDASTDNSAELIRALADEYPTLRTLLLSDNQGNTKAFNKGLKLASGEFIIDMATDDVLLPDRVSLGVKAFLEPGVKAGVNFTNAAVIDSNSNLLYYFYAIDAAGLAINKPKDGSIYEELIQHFFICPPTMMFRKSLLDQLGGYDDELTYEDFDFWIRSSRITEYCYIDRVLVKRRKLKGSHSDNQYKVRSSQMESTFRVCEKVKTLNKIPSENQALKKRIYYELKQCLRFFNIRLAIKYLKLLGSI